MTFNRPTLAEIKQRVEADFDTKIEGADSRVRRRSPLSVLAQVIAGASHYLHGHLDWISKQPFPQTAELENLETLGALVGIYRQSATKATGTVTITGTNGYIVNAGELLRRSDGVEYATATAGTISSGSATVNVEASVSGESGNADSGTILSFVSPITGIDSTATSGELASGIPIESDARFRERVLERWRTTPQGGADFDYKLWAKSIEGVTRVWVYPLELGAGTVTIRFMMDDTYSNGIPLSGDVADVQAYINTVRPVTAAVTVVAPVPTTRNFTITLKKANGDTETSTTVRAAVEAELADMIKRDGEPGGTLYLSRIREAISVAAGEHHHTLTTPSADVVYTTGQIPIMGTVTWA